MIDYDIQKRGTVSKTRFLYESVKEDIKSGKLLPGTRLPSKRDLSKHLSLSVITVENAYMMLEEEGYITAKPRSGFYVRKRSAGEYKSAGTELVLLKEEAGVKANAEASDAYFPAMARTIRKILSERPEIIQEKPPALGCPVLRNALAKYLRRYRSMDVQPANIIIGSGSQYFYGLLVQLFGSEKGFAVEKPSYEKIEKVYKANGAAIDHLEMGPDGILESELVRTKAKILHVTPYHSYPTGVTAPAGKRFEYLAWANNNEGYVIEDDFDSEYAFFRKPIETLFSMDGGHRVVYMNTFTKSLSPAVRTSYIILPDELLKQFSEKLGFYSCPVPVLNQYVLAEYIESGAFERHLGRMRRALEN